jgi:putative peptide modification system cyclase
MATNPFLPTKSEDRPTVSSVLRTVLLCDWADSTRLIETLGDTRAVVLMQKHDQYIREVLSITQGRLIDKSDGILALFERPIQALDFALRYQHQMRLWGSEYQQPIQARIGIHVGDVMTWENAPDQIAAGAKPLEVEGFAKPVAARLMGLAMPGQILLSGMAQSLAQRAQLELGDRGQRLRWLVHGRYTFKGVPAPMLVHEVGDPEFSPLRAPPSTQKAWREIPLWRRPPVLALEVLLSTGLIGGFIWSTFQSPPAIAFYERDWVVMGDLQNLTREKMFDDSLDTALRIGLEQSAYVNVISDNQEQDALKRMQREGQHIDRQTGTELALREGAKALVLPTLTEVGGHLRVTAEVIDPNTGVTVYTESAEATNNSKVLPALDEVLEKLRARLGESISLVDKSSKPLALVTTSSIEALRAYSLGVEAKRESRYNDARLLFKQAIKDDPKFALAYIGLASLDYTNSDSVGFEKNIKLANTYRSHLTNRESLFLDAAAALVENPSASIAQWKLLGKIYPDEFRAHYNYAYFSYVEGHAAKETLNILETALKQQNPGIANAYYLKGLILLYRNEYKLALEAFKQADNSGVRGNKSEYVAAYLAVDDYVNANKIFKSQNKVGDARVDMDSRLSEILMPLSHGDLDAGLKSSRLIRDESMEISNSAATYQGVFLSLQSYSPSKNFNSELQSYLNTQLELLKSSGVTEQRNLLFNINASAWMAARTGDVHMAKQALESTSANNLKYPIAANTDMRLIAEAEVDLANNDVSDAIKTLEKRASAENSLYLLHATLEQAYRRANDSRAADLQLKWLAENRGRAYAEYNNANFLQPVNVFTHYQAESRIKKAPRS